MASSEQPDLLAPRPSPAAGERRLAVMEQRCHDLEILLQATLVAGLVVTAALGLFLAKQMRTARAELAELRPAMQRLTVEFSQKEPK